MSTQIHQLNSSYDVLMVLFYDKNIYTTLTCTVALQFIAFYNIWLNKTWTRSSLKFYNCHEKKEEREKTQITVPMTFKKILATCFWHQYLHVMNSNLMGNPLEKWFEFFSSLYNIASKNFTTLWSLSNIVSWTLCSELILTKAPRIPIWMSIIFNK